MNLNDLAKFAQSPWGWILGVVVLLLLWEGGKKWVPALVEWLARRVRDALAGKRFVHGRALRAYRRKVVSRYRQLPVLFMPGRGLDATAVYVPLRAAEEGVTQQEDAYSQIKSTDHAVILGGPGAGKTMLLRHSMLTWAREANWRRVPVLFELHRCTGNDLTLEEHIVKQLTDDDFRGPERFVRRALADGTLSVLFDGLDELSTAEIGRVVQMLRSFTNRYAKCQIVVTCRTAVYNGSLAPEISTVFHVAEFDDRHIRKFLRQWPDIHDEIAVERLMAALRDAPRIVQLARNPLLLTMIAYLYGDKPASQMVLPHSRAEFYSEATDILLGRLKDTRNVFKVPVKKALLMRLALKAQHVSSAALDRRTLRYEEVVREVIEMAPRLNLAVADADRILDEIVDRSGLLLRVDGGSKFQFAHLSLQEYLAAAAYEQDYEGLFAKYQAAPDDWRETVKLWCGVVSADSGPLIERVFAIDEVLAFECLADASVVNEAVADRIIARFQELLLDSDESLTAAIIVAFGLVASDPRPRGRRVFGFLAAHATEDRPQVCAALAATKLSEAAEILVARIAFPVVRSALSTMGDLALPALRALSCRNDPLRMHALHQIGQIGTPLAAESLVPLLWNSPEAVARPAAWYLAAMLADPAIETALGDLTVPEGAASHAWVWAPFRDDSAPSVAKIATRVATLCERSETADIPLGIGNVDPRIAIPLLILGFGDRLQSRLAALAKRHESLLETVLSPGQQIDARQSGEPTLNIAQKFAARRAEHGNKEQAEPVDKVDSAIVDQVIPDVPAAQSALYHMVGQTLRVAAMSRVAMALHKRSLYDDVRRQDWERSRGAQAEYKLWRSPAHWVILAIISLAEVGVVVGGLALVVDEWPVGPTWLGWLCTGAAFLYAAFLIGVVPLEEGADLVSLLCSLFTPSAILLIVRNFLPLDDFGDLWLLFVVAFGSIANTFTLVIVGVVGAGWWITVGLAVVVTVSVVTLNWRGKRKERAARSPFRGLLDNDGSGVGGQTSVVAA